VIIIKINKVPSSKEGLMERARKAWRIKQDRLYNQDKLIVVYKGEILEEYKVLGYGPAENEPNRVAFDLEEVPNSQLKGQKIDYPTANPCTIVDPADLGLVQSTNEVTKENENVRKPPLKRNIELADLLQNLSNAKDHKGHEYFFEQNDKYLEEVKATIPKIEKALDALKAYLKDK
jgi:hypothetical protein